MSSVPPPPPSSRAPAPETSASLPTVSERSGRLQRVLLGLLAVSLFGCDHATKLAAETKLGDGRSIPLVSGVLELRYAANDDTAFSLLHTFGLTRTPWPLLGLALVASLGIVAVWYFQRQHLGRIQHAGFALVLGGALGNVVDRAVRGYVVDFIHLTHWPVFNVADIAVVIGAALLLLGMRSSAPPDAPAHPLS